MANVLIAGGSGLVGKALTKTLTDAGHQVSILSRRHSGGGVVRTFLWNVEAGQIDDRAVAEADIIINLAGEGIADSRWTVARKKRVIESRTQSAALIKAALVRTGNAANKTYISASAQGFYGHRDDAWMTEKDAPSGIGFLSESCVAWEKAAFSVAETGVRIVVFRIGIVLTMRGGALPKMLVSYKFGVAAYFGNGEQYYAWVHIADLCNMFLFAVENAQVRGIFNASAPNPIPNLQFAKDVATARNKFALPVSVPVFALRIALGEMADTVLTSTRMSMSNMINVGFKFKYPALVPALKALFLNKN